MIKEIKKLTLFEDTDIMVLIKSNKVALFLRKEEEKTTQLKMIVQNDNMGQNHFEYQEDDGGMWFWETWFETGNG